MLPPASAPAAKVQPGDAARSMMLPPASADVTTGPLALAPVAKPPAPAQAKLEQKVDIQAPFTLTVNGDVQDANQLFNKLKPLLDQHQRDFAQKMGNGQLFDAPHV
jgi:hypothetical protein